MPGTKIRYDGLADWYDSFRGPSARESAADLIDLLGPGSGPCLDVGCGTGLNFAAIQATGRLVVGLDRSPDQLRHARGRPGVLMLGDALALPFADGSFGTVTALWVSTDIEDFASMLAEAGRVLAPGGLLLFVGAHPCFNGPHAQNAGDGGIIAHPVYREARWHDDAPWWGDNLRRRVGMRHNTLAGLLSAFPAAGLVIERVTEPGDRPVPVNLAVRARRVPWQPIALPSRGGCHSG